jgi:aldose sugar dehydrogenase
LALTRAKLTLGEGSASLDDLKVIWRDGERGRGGSSAPRSRSRRTATISSWRWATETPAQDPNQPLGKILRLTLDGKPAPGDPMAGKIGAATVPVIDPPADTENAKSAQVIRTYAFPEPNMTPAETWTSGHRTPYGLAFAPDGKLWEVEHGPRGGDEFNLIEPGKNYGWPLVSYAVNYNGVPIPSPDSRPDLAKPVLYWPRHRRDDQGRGALGRRPSHSRRRGWAGRRSLDARRQQFRGVVPRGAEIAPQNTSKENRDLGHRR